MTDSTVSTSTDNERQPNRAGFRSSGIYSIAEAARVLGVSQYRIRKWIDNGEIESWSWRNKFRYIDREEIVRMKQKLRERA